MKMRLAGALVLFAWSFAGAQSAATAHAGAANRLMQDGRYAEAAEEFTQALSLDPSDDTLRVQYATCLFLEENDEPARQQFEMLRQKVGDRPGLMYFLGQLDLRANKYASAIQRLTPLADNPTFPKASYYLGLAYLSVGDDSKAMEFLQKAASQNPRDSEVHYRLARLYSRQGRDEDAAREYETYDGIVEGRRIGEQRGHDCMDALKSGPIDKARPVCNVLADSQDSRELIFVGGLYLQAGAYADALSPLQRAAKLDPKSFEAAYFLGETLYYLRRYSDAVSPLETAIALNPRYFDSLNLLAKTYHLLGNDVAAIPLLERAHNLNPDDRVVTAVLERMRAANSVKH